jgi:hypothetical protein
VLPGVLLPSSRPADERSARARARHAAGDRPLDRHARAACAGSRRRFLPRSRSACVARGRAFRGWATAELRERFLSEIARRRLSESVRWVGWQSDVRPWHLALDVEVLLSDQEGLPLSLVEARALGVPIVATDVGGVAELLRGGEWIVAARDAAGAAARSSTLDELADGSRVPDGAARPDRARARRARATAGRRLTVSARSRDRRSAGRSRRLNPELAPPLAALLGAAAPRRGAPARARRAAASASSTRPARASCHGAGAAGRGSRRSCARGAGRLCRERGARSGRRRCRRRRSSAARDAGGRRAG